MVELGNRRLWRRHLVPVALVLLTGAIPYLLLSFFHGVYTHASAAGILRHDALLQAQVDISASYAMVERRLVGEQIEDAVVLRLCNQAREAVAGSP